MEHMSFVCNYCRSFQSLTVDIPDDVKKDLNHLLTIVTNRCREVLSGNILARAPPPPAKNPYLTSDRKATIGNFHIYYSNFTPPPPSSPNPLFFYRNSNKMKWGMIVIL